MLAYFDCYNGISGDMALGALVDAGVSAQELERTLKKHLRLRGFRLETRRVRQCGLRATQLTVVVSKKHDVPRTFSEIRQIVGKSSLPESVKDKALAAFTRLARAEAKVHRANLKKVHFHEVGSLDAIIDITGTMLALDTLGIEEVYASALPLSSGEIRCHHGTYPVPAPATMELLRGVPLRHSDLRAELVTPTGAALITTIARQFGTVPPFRCERIGYGAGTRTFPNRTNFLRVVLGELLGETRPSVGAPLPAQTVLRESLFLVSTEIDNMNPETYSYLFEQLFAIGCLDVHLIPIQMKKNRPGVSLRMLVQEHLLENVTTFVLRETPTFGLKVQSIERYCLKRTITQVETNYGKIAVKIGFWGDRVLKASPEYESCRQAALRHDASLRDVYDAAVAKINTIHPARKRMKK